MYVFIEIVSTFLYLCKLYNKILENVMTKCIQNLLKSINASVKEGMGER